MITRERIAQMRNGLLPVPSSVSVREDELLDLLDAAESALAMHEDMARIDLANRSVEDMLGRATDSTRTIRDIVTKWMWTHLDKLLATS